MVECVWGWQQCIASPLYGFIPALSALISVDKPCFQSLYMYILSLYVLGVSHPAGVMQLLDNMSESMHMLNLSLSLFPSHI